MSRAKKIKKNYQQIRASKLLSIKPKKQEKDWKYHNITESEEKPIAIERYCSEQYVVHNYKNTE